MCVNNEVTQKWATRVTSHTVSLAISRGMVSLFHLLTNKMAFKVAKLGRTLVLFGSYSAFFQRTVSLCRSSPRQRFMSSESVATQQQQQQQQERDPETQLLPTMIIFDLDDCLWSPEMHELWSNPSIKEKGNLGDDKNSQGVVGMKVPPAGPTVRLFPGARRVLRELATNPKYAGILLGVASSSLEPSYSHACLEGIEILPQLTMRQLIQYDQIGRTGPLSPDKRTHFRLLHQESNVPYKEMLFFDDCNWGDVSAHYARRTWFCWKAGVSNS